jgi:hypothetical protein
VETKRLELEVTFVIEFRPATPEQKDAGKRLFSKLAERARAVGAAGAAACNNGSDKAKK